MFLSAATIACAMLAQTTAPAGSANTATQPFPVATHQVTGFTDSARRLLGPTFEMTSLYGWLGLLAAILLGLVVGRIVSTILLSAAARIQNRGWQARGAVLRHAAGPANLAIGSIGLALGLQLIYLTDGVRSVVAKVIALLLILSAAWFIYNLVSLVDIALRRVLRRTDPKLTETIVALIRKALRIFLLVVVALFVLQNVFGAEITAWLAGLGIAGLAVSLAAQDPIKNIFGSFTVLAERPFVLGDRVIFNHIDGTVEDIGFRSTRIRTVAGHLVTVPNMKFTDSIIENITRRPSLRRVVNIGLTCDTPPDKVEEAVRLIEGALNDPAIAGELNLPAEPPRVVFDEMKADNLNIQVTYWYAINREGRDWWSYLRHAQALNLKIMRAFEKAGIRFAFPTQTVHVVREDSDDGAPGIVGR